MTIPILSIVGRSGSGKTYLLENLIPELKQRGYRVATVKHHFHPGFEIDYPGKDTWRHAKAGSDLVIIASPDKIASIQRLDRELELDEIVAGIQQIDIVLTEGYIRAGKPALEVVKSDEGFELLCSPEQLIAIATDTRLEIEIPQFSIDDTPAIADLIERKFLLHNIR